MANQFLGAAAQNSRVFYFSLVERIKMAMSQGEYLRRIQEEQIRYVSRSKVRDQSELTQIQQARASGHMFQREKGSADAYSMKKTFGPTDHAINANIQNSIEDTTCCRTYVASGSETNSGSVGVLQAAQKCAVCSDPDPVLNRGVTLNAPCYDRSLPPFAQSPPGSYIPVCKVCKTTYFNSQPNCGCYSSSYDVSLIDKKFGDGGFPTPATNTITNRGGT